MNIRKRRLLRRRLQAFLFAAVLFWMAASFLSSLPAMAVHQGTIPEIFDGYVRVETYQGYAYALEGENGTEAIAVENDNGGWKRLCSTSTHMSGLDIVQNCGIPVAIARHLKVLSKKGLAHDIVVPAS